MDEGTMLNGAHSKFLDLQEAKRKEKLQEAWQSLINMCNADTLLGMYVAVTGGSNLLGSLIGGGPYSEDLSTEETEEGIRLLDDDDRAVIQTDLILFTNDSVKPSDIFDLEQKFTECMLENDTEH